MGVPYPDWSPTTSEVLQLGRSPVAEIIFEIIFSKTIREPFMPPQTASPETIERLEDHESVTTQLLKLGPCNNVDLFVRLGLQVSVPNIRIGRSRLAYLPGRFGTYYISCSPTHDLSHGRMFSFALPSHTVR